MTSAHPPTLYSVIGHGWLHGPGGSHVAAAAPWHRWYTAVES